MHAGLAALYWHRGQEAAAETEWVCGVAVWHTSFVAPAAGGRQGVNMACFGLHIQNSC